MKNIEKNYYLQDKDNVIMVGLERTIVGLDFRYDPDLKIVKVTCR